MKRKFLLSTAMLMCTIVMLAQDANTTAAEKETAYIKTISQRAEKIVAKLAITDPDKAGRVSNMVAKQYRDLNSIYTKRDNSLQGLKQRAGAAKPDESLVKQVNAATAAATDSLHAIYVAQLQKELTAQQVAQIKDGMTFGVLPITYSGYLDMLPALTEPQKKQILEYLTEAREHAMDAESSEKKHGWFGKYKGKINNYLSKEGYDMKKAGQEWEARIKERKRNQ